METKREVKVGDLVWSREESMDGAWFQYGIVTNVKPLKAVWGHMHIGLDGDVRHFSLSLLPGYPLDDMVVVPQPEVKK